MKAEMCSDCSRHLESNWKTKRGGADKQKWWGEKRKNPSTSPLESLFDSPQLSKVAGEHYCCCLHGKISLPMCRLVQLIFCIFLSFLNAISGPSGGVEQVTSTRFDAGKQGTSCTNV